MRIGITTTGLAWLLIEAMKLERGNIPTDWSPATEDLSGGVICNHSIGYELWKGGVPHESANHTAKRLRGGSNCHLTFQSLDAVCQFLGHATEISGRKNIPFYSALGTRRCKHNYTARDVYAERYRRHARPSGLQYRRSIDDCRREAGRVCFAAYTAGVVDEWNVPQDNERQQMGILVSDLGRGSTDLSARIARKEVAYV